MAQTIPCDLCEEHPALLLVTFIPKAETIGLGLECITTWAESLAQAAQAEGDENINPDALVIRIIAIPTGDEEVLTIGGALVWAEAMVRAIEAQETAQAAGEGVEPITTPTRPRKARKAPRGPVEAPPEAAAMTDEDWEVSGLEGRPPLADTGTESDRPGPDLEAGTPSPADD